MAYDRPPNNDRLASIEFEETVRGWLGDHVVSATNSTSKLDFHIPGISVEVKEKRQPLGGRWHLLPGVDERDLFVIDELSIRKALAHWPAAFFVIRDVPCDRLFVAPIWLMVGVERVRVDRTFTGGQRRGKWIIPLTSLIQLDNPEAELLPLLQRLAISGEWLDTHCISTMEVATI